MRWAASDVSPSSHLAFHIPTLAGFCLLFVLCCCLVCCFGVFLFPVFALLCFWFLFCKCLGIPNSPRSLDLDDRQGLIARSAMQQKKSMASQSSLAFATKIGWKPSALMFHFWIRQVTSRAREPLAASFRSKMCGSPYYWFLCKTSHITCLNGFNDRGTPAGRGTRHTECSSY